MHMRVLKMIFLCCFLVVLAGCGTIDSDIEIDNDFKGKWEATVDIGGEKSKEEIASILNSSSIPKIELNRIEENAKAEYPDDYTLQKAFIKGAIKTYNDLKK